MDKATQETMRENNQRLMLQALFNAPETSRAAIASRLNLHKSTISSIYRDLDEAGYIEELGEGQTSEAGGRRPKMVRFNRQYGYVLAFNMGSHHLRYAAVRLTGEIIELDAIDVREWPLEAIVEHMKMLVKKAEKFDTLHGLLGVVVGIYGVVDDNRVVYSPFFDYQRVDVAQTLQNVTDVPILLENEANLAAVYTRDFHDYTKKSTLHNFVVISIHHGIGAGLIVQNQLHRGLNGQAGEIGRSVYEISADGHVVRLEDLYSEEAMLQRYGQQIGKKIERADFLAAVRNNDLSAQRLISDWVSGVAYTIFNLIQQNAPEAVFIHSRFIAEMPDLLGQVVNAYQGLNPTNKTDILFANNSVYQATLLGGAALITREVLDLADLSLHFHLNQNVR